MPFTVHGAERDVVALDATCGVGSQLSGVGTYCRELLQTLAAEYGSADFLFCYRTQGWWRSRSERLPANARRFLLHDRWHVPGRAAVFHGLNQRMPLKRLRRSVCTFHDLFVMTNEFSTAEFRARFTQLSREAVASSDLLIAVSQFTASQMAGLLGVDEGRIRIIPHGIAPVTHVEQAREPMVLHVGTIQRRKNTTRLVRAFAALPAPWRLVLAGAASGFAAHETMQEIESSAVKDRISVTGYLGAAELARLYARASIFAFPSLGEGFGLPVLEAMAHGVPVVSSNVSSLPEVCGDAALLVDPLREEAIAGALSQLASDEELRKETLRKGFAQVAQFTWQRAAASTWAVYKELTGSKVSQAHHRERS